MIKELFAIFLDSSGTFEGQAADEKVVRLVRRHPFFILVRLGVFGLACLMPIAVGMLFMNEIAALGLGGLFLALASIWYLVIWLGIFYSLTLYSLNVLIITDRRIVHNDQFGLFNRKVSELAYPRIQDVSIHIGGLVETLLHFGNITIQTAGAEKQFIFRQVPRANEVKDEIMRLAAANRTLGL